MTHYKWYDHKHTQTSYTKQLTNNDKQTDKTKENKKKYTKGTNQQTPLPHPHKKGKEEKTQRDRERQTDRERQRERDRQTERE